MMIESARELQTADFSGGVSLLVDKPLNWTSFDVVNKIRSMLRHKLGVKKIKVGHAGTLDPLATGLLIIAVGRDTKMITQYQDLDKTYSGRLRLGASTPSYDSEFEPDQYFPIEHITMELIEQARIGFTGEIVQSPPAFSAVKLKGQRAYQLARKGIDIELQTRPQFIHSFSIDPHGFPELDFEVCCNKGTYIRSLVHDFGKALGSGAYLLALRRTAIGPHRVDNAFSLETLTQWLKSPQ